MNINPILLDIPNQYESTRLILRTPRDGDGKVLFPAIQETQDSLSQWFFMLTIPTTTEEAEEHLRQARAELVLRHSIRLLIFRQDTGTFIGEGQFYHFNWDVPRCEMSYWVRQSMQNQGYMTEAIRRMTDIAFDVLNMQRIDVRFDADNTASYRVSEKAGYSLEGKLRNHRRRRNGQLADTVVYSMIPDDWTTLKDVSSTD